MFWSRIARDAGWQLDWRSAHGSTNDAACRAASDDGNLEPLRRMFSAITTPVHASSQRDAQWMLAERTRLALGSQRRRPPVDPIERLDSDPHFPRQLTAGLERPRMVIMSNTGYARVSTRDQNPGSQEALLREAGCDRRDCGRARAAARLHDP